MLVADLILVLIAFVALVLYIVTTSTWSLVVLFIAVGLGVILFIADSWRKWTKRGK